MLAGLNMWVPTLASLVGRLVLRESLVDVSFGVGGWRGLRLAWLGWLYPVGVCLMAYGIAWTTHLDAFAPPRASGLMWSAWHLPLILSGQYAAGPNRALSAGLFVVSTTAGGYVAARVRLDSGSVWPAVLFHASWNAVVQGVFDGFTAGGSASYTTTRWTGESGILVVLVNVAFAVLLFRKPWSARRRPGAEVMATFSWRNA